jgi:phosphoglycolate phosphatase-like HAD superfamily hydrolase
LKKFKAVIFDLDHTLLKSNINFSEMKSNILNYLKQNLSLSMEQYRDRSTHEIISYAIKSLGEQGKSETVPKVVGELNRIMTDIEMKYVSNATLLQGAAQALNRLKIAGIKIGILTRSCREYTDETLKSTGLSMFVDEVAARDDCDNPKPEPNQVYWLMDKMKVKPDHVVMVGDHPIDLLCAKNAGVSFVGVLTGSWGMEQMKKLGPTVISSVKELPDLLGV